MSRTSILIDANYWIALANPRDKHHKRSVSLAEEIAHQDYGKKITSDYVFDEAVTVAQRKASHDQALEIGNLILNSEVVLVRIDSHLFDAAWKLFNFQKKDLSFTDCTNIVMMNSFGIKNIATFDKGFERIKGINVVS